VCLVAHVLGVCSVCLPISVDLALLSDLCPVDKLLNKLRRKYGR
jgi:hypothetical protein